MSGERTVVGDYSFPSAVEPKDELVYKIPFGSDEVEDLKWEGYVDVAHQLGAREIRSNLVDSGVNDGIQYAVVKTTVVTEDGNEFSKFGSADETTNQVRDPEFVWVVAESRSVKRAVKTAYNIYPTDKSASDEPGFDETGPPDDVEFDDGHALADKYGDADTGGEW